MIYAIINSGEFLSSAIHVADILSGWIYSALFSRQATFERRSRDRPPPLWFNK
jgi:hypothetical protein